VWSGFGGNPSLAGQGGRFDVGVWYRVMDDLILVKVLECVNRADGIIGRSGVYKLLQGRNSKKFAKYGLNHLPEFGALSHISKSEILTHTDYLLERGCLQIGMLLFPMIQITDVGRNRLDRLLKKTPGLEAPQMEIDDLHVCNEIDFWKLFPLDLEKARSSVVIISAFVSDYRVGLLLPELEKLKARRVKVLAYIRPTSNVADKTAIDRLKSAGVEVVFKKRIHQKIAIIDDSIGWSGRLNILQHIDSHDQMTRHTDSEHVKKLVKLL
jgi:hypothetical protein